MALVIPIAGVTAGVLGSFRESMANVIRKIGIVIKNPTGVTFENPATYFVSGVSDYVPPFTIPGGQALVWGARKTAGPVATGSVGVITYQLKDRDSTLAVMWSVPFDYNLYSNWWGVKVYDGYHSANKDIYNEMYEDFELPGDGTWKNGSAHPWTFQGYMTNSGTPTLEIIITDKL